LAIADELVAQGCYDCLLDARAQYESLSARTPALLWKVFEVDLLLALREKELSIDPTATLTRAESLIPRLSKPLPGGTPDRGALRPPSTRGTPDRGALRVATSDVVSAFKRTLELVKAVPPDAAGRRVLITPGPAQAELDSAIAGIDAGPFSPVFTRYLKLSLQCGRLTNVSSAAVSDDVPLLTYRSAICDAPVRVQPLEAVRTAVPRFVETSFFRGRAAKGTLFRTDGSAVRKLFDEAYARFPNSPAIAYELGSVYQTTNDCRNADLYFSRALELSPAHEDARLGRTICRTYLSRNEEAIADATVLIDTSSSATNRGDAYYWRAWNRRRLKQIEAARADINRARSLRYNARVLTLAGMIEYDQRDFDTARRDLDQARNMDDRECEAPWYLGLVELSVETWAASANGFAGAARCYDLLVKESERLRAEMAARTDVTEEFRSRQLAGFDAAIAEDSTQRSAAELNAAINYGRAGDIPNATVYMKRAAVDPQRRTAVEDLRQVLGVPRW
jgi:tetratricopeptide (TPR) repeat protein